MRINTNINTIPDIVVTKLNVAELNAVYYNHFMTTIPFINEVMYRSKNGKRRIRSLSNNALNNLVYIVKEGIIEDPEQNITMLDLQGNIYGISIRLPIYRKNKLCDWFVVQAPITKKLYFKLVKIFYNNRYPLFS